MGYGDHWAKAKDEASKVVDSARRARTSATLILFGTGAEEAFAPTSIAAGSRRRSTKRRVSSEATRYAPALRLGAELAEPARRCRARRPYLISDFQKSGWERQEEIRMPEGATLTPISVATPDTSDSAVDVGRRSSAPRSPNEERVTITAGSDQPQRDAGDDAPRQARDRRPARRHRAPVTIGPNASGSVTFAQVTAAQPNMRGTIRAGTDALPKDNDFHFVLSPSRPVSVLVIQGEGAPPSSSLLPDDRALDRQDAAVQDRRGAGVTRHRRRISSADPSSILNDATTLSDRRPTTC